MNLSLTLAVILIFGSCSTTNNIHSLLREPSSLFVSKEKRLHRLHVDRTSNRPANVDRSNCFKNPVEGIHKICEGDIFESYYDYLGRAVPQDTKSYRKYIKSWKFEHSAVTINDNFHIGDYSRFLTEKIGNIKDSGQGAPLRISIFKSQCQDIGVCHVMRIYRNHSTTPTATWLVDIGPRVPKGTYLGGPRPDKTPYRYNNFNIGGPAVFRSIQFRTVEVEYIAESGITVGDVGSHELFIFKSKKPVTGKIIETNHGVRLEQRHYEQLEEWIKISAPLGNSSIDLNI